MNYMTMPGLNGNPKLVGLGLKATNIVIDYFNLTMDDLTGRWRPRKIVIARHIVFYLLRREYGMGLANIGKIFNRDHTTVMHAVKTVQDMLYTGNPEVVKCFEEIKVLLKK